RIGAHPHIDAIPADALGACPVASFAIVPKAELVVELQVELPEVLEDPRRGEGPVFFQLHAVPAALPLEFSVDRDLLENGKGTLLSPGEDRMQMVPVGSPQ